MFAIDREPFAAGGEDVDRARGADDPLGERRGPGENVLTVVEDHESLAIREMLEQLCIEAPEGLFSQAENGRYGTGDIR